MRLARAEWDPLEGHCTTSETSDVTAHLPRSPQVPLKSLRRHPPSFVFRAPPPSLFELELASLSQRRLVNQAPFHLLTHLTTLPLPSISSLFAGANSQLPRILNDDPRTSLPVDHLLSD